MLFSFLYFFSVKYCSLQLFTNVKLWYKLTFLQCAALVNENKKKWGKCWILFLVNCQHQLKKNTCYISYHFKLFNFLCTFWLYAFSFNFLYCHFIFDFCVYNVKPHFLNKIQFLQLDINRGILLAPASFQMHVLKGTI